MNTKHPLQAILIRCTPHNSVVGRRLTVPLWVFLAALFLALLLAGPSSPAHAEPPDGGFNPGANGDVTALAVQADGKIVVGGWFTTLGGQTRNYIGRLNPDGTLDATFDPGANNNVYALAVQADGKIVVGGAFTTLGGQPRNYIGRLNADGSLDTTFNPGASDAVKALAVQADGKIVVGGYFFTTLGGQPRNYIGRLNADGSLDTNFNPDAQSIVHTLAVQADGKIVVGGRFIMLGGQTRNRIGRLNADGTLDTTFDPGANNVVNALALQADGKIVVGGSFFTLGGQQSLHIGRLNADGTLDDGFIPWTNGAVEALVVHADGKIVMGGSFTTLTSQPRNNIARLYPDGSLDTNFDPGADSLVNALALQADGRIVVGGAFTTLGGLPRNHIARLRYDWLGTDLMVELYGHGQDKFVPGGEEGYAIAYSNNTAQRTLQNAVLVIALPAFADYLDNSGGGILWPQRRQLFWKLGDLAPGSSGLVSFRVRFFWGIPFGIKDAVQAQMGGTNFPGGFNVQSYLDYVPTTVVAERQLTSNEVQAERQAYPELNQLYSQATQEGFAFGVANSLTLSTGEQMTETVLLRFQPKFAAMFLRRQGGRAQATLVDSSSYVVRSTRGVQSFNFQTDEWEIVAGSASTGSLGRQAESASFSQCMKNCIMELVPKFVIKNLVKAVSTVSKGVDCYKAATGDEFAMAKCAQIVKKIPGVSEGIDLGRCNSDCQQNPDSHVCTQDIRLCDTAGFPYGWFGIHSITTYDCITDPATGKAGQYMAGRTTQTCAICEKCVDTGSGPVCTTPSTTGGSLSGAPVRLEAVSSGSGRICNECVAAKDPNAKYGAEGDVFPGQPMTYTITFENEGAGDAFGVFVVDKLGEHLDTSTLTIYGGGEFNTASNTLTWSVGQLAPKGQPGSTGVVSFTVRLKPNLPTGTVVVNQAVVHFPSVPEETPTNPVINIVQPLAAIPQAVETVAGQAVPIGLQGRSASGASLTYAIVEQPLNGELSGTLPNLTYTPAANFTGLDHLRFTVSDGITTSRPDEVQILVRPSANDTTPPRILWTAPENGAVIAQIVTTPRFTDTVGLLYLPPVQIEFSEAISSTTVTTDTVRMTDGSGRALALRVTYDGLVGQAMILSREPLRKGEQYTVTVTGGVKDLMGNSLAAAYIWSFQIGGSTIYLPFISK